ncbi:alpha/beta hydrolase [Halorubellus sp. PRR65]|uniref:alpha/beta hydrolase n=1 Tax=Halorubellus sp. PRR65 TaxID=3098148 RepID=UPI002B2610F3|nr:alpha/beta hydrolase [Halorubellus sp. PRR65]
MTDAEGGELDAEFAGLVESFAETGLPPWHSMAVDAARRLEDDVFGDGGGPEMTTVREFAVDGPDGEHSIPVRAYRPTDRQRRDAGVDGDPGVLVFAHGGVFVLGTLDSADDVCRALAAGTGRVVLSVDYRLAPDHPFPAAVDDAFAVVEWAGEYADAFGADTDAVGVAGTSAGGGIAAATALRAGHVGVDLDVQVLLYPMLSAESAFDGPSAPAARARRASYDEHDDAALLSTADVAWGWRRYLRSPVDAHNPFAAPLGAPSHLLADAPPAVVATAGVDVLRDEAAAYVDALADADVPVTHAHYPTLAHGFCSVTDDVALAADAVDEVADAVDDHVR